MKYLRNTLRYIAVVLVFCLTFSLSSFAQRLDNWTDVSNWTEVSNWTDVSNWTEIGPFANTVTSVISYLLSFNLNGTATVGDSVTDGYTGTGDRYVRAWSLANGVELQAINGKEAFISEGERWTGTEFVNNDGSGNKLHPTHNYTDADGNTREAYSLYDYWATGQSVSIGDKRYYAGTDNHNYALTATTAGTTSGTLSVAKTDIGSTVSDGAVTWSVDSYYSNLATSTTNYLPHVLSEVSATQIAQYTEDFTNWGVANGSVTANDTTAPDGETTADKFVDSGATGTNINVGLSYSLSVTSGVEQCLSVHFKKADADWVYLRTVAFDATANGITYFNLSTGQVGTQAAVHTNAGIEKINADWYRAFITFTTTTDVDGVVYIRVSDADASTTATLDGASTFYVWGAQLEAGSKPTSYIPNLDNTASVTRPATSYTVSPSLIPTGNHQGRLRWISSGVSGEYIVSDVLDTNNQFIIYTSGNDLRLDTRDPIDGLNRSTVTTSGFVDGQVYNVGWSIVGDEITLSVDGTADATPGSGYTERSNDTFTAVASTTTSTDQTKGVTDIQINTDTSDLTWRDDTTWSQP